MKAEIPAGTRDTVGTGCGLYTVSKSGNRTRTRVTRFGNTAGLTVPVVIPSCHCRHQQKPQQPQQQQ